MQSNRRRVAVIGGGISGLTAAYILRRDFRVTVYESDDRLGGHAHTHILPVRDGDQIAVDSGFITFSRKSYPQLTRLFDELQVESNPTRFSFAIHCDGCGLEYLVSNERRALRPRVRSGDRAKYLALIAQIPFFNLGLWRLTQRGFTGSGGSLDDFLRQGRFSHYFTQHYVVPLVSSLWSCPPELVRTYPATYVASYLQQHGLLSLVRSNGWRTVNGGSRTYVDRLASTLDDVRLSTPVQRVRRMSAGVQIVDQAGNTEDFDALVLAAHADQSLSLLADPTELERRVLGAFGYSRNLVVVHTDESVLNERRQTRGSWNYRVASCSISSGSAQVTYDMNMLQRLDAPHNCFVTLNANSAIRQDRILAEAKYAHPVENAASVAARRLLPALATPQTVYAGSYHGWSSHEDGCRSGVAAAASLGVNW